MQIWTRSFRMPVLGKRDPGSAPGWVNIRFSLGADWLAKNQEDGRIRRYDATKP